MQDTLKVLKNVQHIRNILKEKYIIDHFAFRYQQKGLLRDGIHVRFKCIYKYKSK